MSSYQEQGTLSCSPVNYLQDYILVKEAAASPAMFQLVGLYRLRRGIDLDRLASALLASAASHEALATVFRREPDGRVIQAREIDTTAFTCPVIAADEDSVLAKRDALARPLDPFGGCLFESAIYDCGERAYLLSNFHHLICDGYSFSLILEDARRVWNGEALSSDGYYDVLARRRARAALPLADELRAELRARLAAHDYTMLPAADARGASALCEREFPLRLPVDFDARLMTFSVTRHHVFLAAAVLALARLTGREHLLIDWVFHGRQTKQEMRTAGPFMVDMPLFFHATPGQTTESALAQIRRMTAFGIRNVSALRGVSDCNPGGQPRLTFNYHGAWGELMTPGPVSAGGPFAWMIEETMFLATSAVAENPFNVVVRENRGATRLTIEFDAGLYSPALVDAYARHYAEALADLF